MRLTPEQLNRTLLHRQHLLERARLDAARDGEHLVGLQAQENLPPYLSLAARLAASRPARRHARASRTDPGPAADPARHHPPAHRRRRAALRPWTAPVQERELRISQNPAPGPRPRPRGVRRRAPGTPSPTVRCRRRRWASAWPQRFPGVPPAALGQLARVDPPLVQVPPRGTLEGLGRRGLPVRRPLARPAAGRARPGRDRAALPACLRPGLGRRRHRVVGRHPARPRSSRGWPTWSSHEDDARARCSTTCPRASSPTRTPRRRCGCSAPTTTSGSPTPAATGSPAAEQRKPGWAANGGVA